MGLIFWFVVFVFIVAGVILLTFLGAVIGDLWKRFRLKQRAGDLLAVLSETEPRTMNQIEQLLRQRRGLAENEKVLFFDEINSLLQRRLISPSFALTQGEYQLMYIRTPPRTTVNELYPAVKKN